MSFTLQTLTEGIRDRHVGQQNKRLVEKWSRTGLLRGMDDVNRENMATLLENQAAQVLREANTMGSSGSDVGGFTNIAFPIVRRVFGGLVANELVSIQPMSLPSGLLFYLDYTYGNDNGPYTAGQSIYGQPSGKAIQEGADAVGGQYDLAGSGFSRTYDSIASLNLATGDADAATRLFSVDADDVISLGTNNVELAGASTSGLGGRLMQFDSALLDSSEKFNFLLIPLDLLSAKSPDLSLVRNISITEGAAGDCDSLKDVPPALQGGKSSLNIRRLNQIVKVTGVATEGAALTVGNIAAIAPVAEGSTVSADDHALLCVVVKDGTTAVDHAKLGKGVLDIEFVKADKVSFAGGGEATGAPSFESNFGGSGSPGDPSPEIPEIDIKIESIPVTAQTRKLRARWSPELAQDLNAYHSMDAEVELTQILSEQIALEIDREILGDLLSGAKGANFFWSRSPGKFVNKRTGAEIARTSTLNPGPAFTGTVREWYETLTETVIDVANEIHRKTLRGSANFIVVSPDVATILEASVLYRPSYSLDGDGQVGAPFTMGAEKIGTLSNRFTVYKDPYFPRNKILVGYKGGSYLETGFVYAPYVPLIVTPTIFQPEDFTPRKGVMTRYGKKMVRADFYGTVTCLDMNII
tara:strand:+ start:10018 stop:11934 length:1917 start_codon:yes stop_codon:yes gene_type:complete